MTHPMHAALERLHALRASLADAYAAGYRHAVSDRSNQRPSPWPSDGKRGPKAYGAWLDEEATLSAIIDGHANGDSPAQIARSLNDAGHRTRSESRWTESAVRAVLEKGRHGPHD